MQKIRSIMLTHIIVSLSLSSWAVEHAPNLSAAPEEVESHLPLGEARTFEVKETGLKLPYRILAPIEMQTGRKYPLLVCLHGAGSRGSDNEKQHKGFVELLKRDIRDSYPAFMFFPQVPVNRVWATFGWGTGNRTEMTEIPSPVLAATRALIDRLLEELPIDVDRLYITGMSMGGYGTWEAIQRWPDLFAAAVPICGGGDPSQATKLVNLPLWAFHGKRDAVIKYEATQQAIVAIEKAGGKPRCTLYPQVAHEAWISAYKEPELLPWLFSQKRPAALRALELAAQKQLESSAVELQDITRRATLKGSVKGTANVRDPLGDHAHFMFEISVKHGSSVASIKKWTAGDWQRKQNRIEFIIPEIGVSEGIELEYLLDVWANSCKAQHVLKELPAKSRALDGGFWDPPISYQPTHAAKRVSFRLKAGEETHVGELILSPMGSEK